MTHMFQTQAVPKVSTPSELGSRTIITSTRGENWDRENNDLAGVFEEHLNYETVPVKHDRTIVQLVSWDESYSDLKTQPEVDDLRAVFEEDYHFEVRESVLNPKVQKKSEKTLLILYYAGHGWHEDSGTLYLAGNSSQEAQAQKDRNSIAWHSVEMCFKYTPADVLVIFDCCYAGGLRSSYRGTHSCFEFLGACDVGERTPKPGERSFTRALINALLDLKGKGGFDSAELERTIRRFAVHDSVNPINPVLFPRKEPSPDHIWIAPLTQDGNGLYGLLQRDGNGQPQQHHSDRRTECVDVRFHFTKSQKQEEIANLALALRRFVKEDGPALSLARVSFLSKTSLFQNVALRWREIGSLIPEMEQDEQGEEIRTMIRQEVRRRDSELVQTVNQTAWWGLVSTKGFISGAVITLLLTHRLLSTSART